MAMQVGKPSPRKLVTKGFAFLGCWPIFDPAMRKPLLALTVAAIPFLSSGQARLVLNNNAWMVIDGNAWVVIENPATNAITTAGTGGNILSENEFDRIRWQIGTTTGAYVLPWTTPSGVKMPLTYTKSTAGAGPATASIVFSTYNYGIAPAP
jgi:hypothetical protein